MVKKLILFFIIFISSLSWAAEFSASVDQVNINSNESFNLSLKLTDATLKGTLDISQLKEDFDILSNQYFSNMQIYNGKSSVTNEWQYSLMPKKPGEFTIPAIRINSSEGELTTKPLSIKVTKAKLSSKDEQHNLFINSSVTNNKPYIYQPIIFQLKLITKHALNNVVFSDLKFNDVIIKVLGKHKIYDRKLKNSQEKVIELDYMIIPLKSGKITIPAQTIKGQIIWQENKNQHSNQNHFYRPFILFNDEEQNITTINRSKMFSLLSEEIVLDVQPQPTKTKPWLPAEDLSISAKFEDESFRVGKPIKYSLIISAKGLTGKQLPSLGEESVKGEGYKIYAEKPEINEKIDNLIITSTREETFILTPQKSGKITLPQIKIEWWDVKKNQKAYAVLPEKIIEVSPNNNAEDAPLTVSKDEEISKVNKPGNKLINYFQVLLDYRINRKTIIIISLILLFFTIRLVWLKYRSVKFSKGNTLITTEEEISPSQVKISQPIKKLNLDWDNINSVRNLYVFLQEYAAHYWQVPKNSSLETIFTTLEKQNNNIRKEEYQIIINQIHGALYGNKKADIKELKKYCDHILKLAKKKTNLTEDKETSKLPKLNP